MSMQKYFGMFAFSLALITGCSELAEQDTGSRQQADLMIKPNGRTPYYLATVLAPPNSLPIRGIHLWPGSAPTIMTQYSDATGVVDSIKLNNQTGTALSSNQGWFYVTMNGASVQVNGSVPLDLHVGAPFNGKIHITGSGIANANSGERYFAVFQPDAGGSLMLCPQDYLPATETTPAQYWNANLIPVAGAKWDLATGGRTTDANAITLACGHDPVGACVQWGYEPWGTYNPGCSGQYCFPSSLANHHQACTRMKRADFCGDGRSWTHEPPDTLQAGQIDIQIFDNAGIHDSLPQTRYTMEANWNTNGAVCVNPTELRRPTMRDPNGNFFNPATSCGTPIPTCSSSTPTWRTGSARPCTQVSSPWGLCVAN